MFVKFIVDLDVENKKVVLRRFRPDGSEGESNTYGISELTMDGGFLEIWARCKDALPEDTLKDVHTAVQLLSE